MARSTASHTGDSTLRTYRSGVHIVRFRVKKMLRIMHSERDCVAMRSCHRCASLAQIYTDVYTGANDWTPITNDPHTCGFSPSRGLRSTDSKTNHKGELYRRRVPPPLLSVGERVCSEKTVAGVRIWMDKDTENTRRLFRTCTPADLSRHTTLHAAQSQKTRHT